MESVEVTFLAGSGVKGSKDAAGTAAEINGCEGMCYSAATELLVLTEPNPSRIRCMFPVTQKRRSELEAALNSALYENGTIPIHPLISIIFDFAIGDRTLLALSHAATANPHVRSDSL